MASSAGLEAARSRVVVCDNGTGVRLPPAQSRWHACKVANALPHALYDRPHAAGARISHPSHVELALDLYPHITYAQPPDDAPPTGAPCPAPSALMHALRRTRAASPQLVKCGFAGDVFPRAVFPCLVGRPSFRCVPARMRAHMRGWYACACACVVCACVRVCMPRGGREGWTASISHPSPQPCWCHMPCPLQAVPPSPACWAPTYNHTQW